MMLIDRRYAWDWLAILLLMVILVITEKLKPFEKSIYHEDDSVRLHNHRVQMSMQPETPFCSSTQYYVKKYALACACSNSLRKARCCMEYNRQIAHGTWPS